MTSRTPARLGLIPLPFLLLALLSGATLAEPWIEVQPTALDFALSPGDSAEAEVIVTHTGDSGALSYNVELVDPYLPGGPLGGREIEGSTFLSDPNAYLPDTQTAFTLSVFNGSEDFDWINEIRLSLPPTVSVVSSSHFVGGSGGILVTNYVTGPGVELIWSDANGGWGNIYDGETAQATVTLAFDPDLVGTLELPWLLQGDGYGDPPHELIGKLELSGPEVGSIDLIEPNGGEVWALGQTERVRWNCDAGIESVDIFLSRDTGSNWEPLIAAVPADLWEFAWEVTPPLSARCRVRVAESGGGATSESTANFFIHRPVDWLEFSADHGQLMPGESDTLIVEIDGETLGDLLFYEATLRFVSNAGNGDVELPVTVSLGTTPVDTAPAPGRGVGAWPNPFNPSTRIAFELAAAGPARLSMHDVRGRLLVVLLDGHLAAGAHELAWDGRDHTGKELPSGIYLLALEAGERRERAKLVLLR